jgi:hypothetical protein
MSKLDDITPSRPATGEYSVELQVEGEWVILGLMTKAQILEWSDEFDRIMEES